MRKRHLAVALLAMAVFHACSLSLAETGKPCVGDDDCADDHYCERAFFAAEGRDGGVCLPGAAPQASGLNQHAVARSALVVARLSDGVAQGQLTVIDAEDDPVSFVAKVDADVPTGPFQVDETGAFSFSLEALGSARVIVEGEEKPAGFDEVRRFTASIFVVVLDGGDVSVWSGAQDSDVFADANWDGGVPDLGVDAIIVPACCQTASTPAPTPPTPSPTPSFKGARS